MIRAATLIAVGVVAGCDNAPSGARAYAEMVDRRSVSTRIAAFVTERALADIDRCLDDFAPMRLQRVASRRLPGVTYINEAQAVAVRAIDGGAVRELHVIRRPGRSITALQAEAFAACAPPARGKAGGGR